MAHLCVFTVADLDYTWIGRADDPVICRGDLAATSPQEPLYWAVFFKQGHLLDDIVNALERRHISAVWHEIAPDEAAHAITALARASFEGYRAWQSKGVVPTQISALAADADGKLIGSSTP